jgi:RNA polymerase sigma factor (sigma-70 family)
MNKNWVLTQESFDSLLAWLDTERQLAGQKYEEIRRRLIKIFTCRGCFEPEDLADETINRVTKRLPEIEATFTGEPSNYFFGVANKVYMEYLRRKPALPPLNPCEDSERLERDYECLEQCLQKLTAENRSLVLLYYEQEKGAKIEHRKKLAEQLGIAVNALRIRAHRIRLALEECVEQCLQAAST